MPLFRPGDLSAAPARSASTSHLRRSQLTRPKERSVRSSAATSTLTGRNRSSKDPGSGSRSSNATRGSALTRPGGGQAFHLGQSNPRLQDDRDALARQRAVVTQPEHQLLAGTKATQCTADDGHGVAVEAQERLWVAQPVAHFHRGHFAPVRGRRQGLACEPKLLAGHDEAITDPLNTRCLTTRSGASQAAAGRRFQGVCGGRVGMCRPRANASRPWRWQAVPCHRQAKPAKIFAEAPNGGFELRNPAQQDGGIEGCARIGILSKRIQHKE